MSKLNTITVYDPKVLAIIVAELTKSGVQWEIKSFATDNLPSKWEIKLTGGF